MSLCSFKVSLSSFCVPEAETNVMLDAFGKLENKNSKGEMVATCWTVVVVVGLLVSGQILREYRTYDVGWACVS